MPEGSEEAEVKKMKDVDRNEEVVDVAEELQKKGVVQKRV